MNKTIKYKVEFFADWHCGSGLSSGADLDLLVIKDKEHLPFISGKTIKGLVREAVEEINSITNRELKITDLFGEEGKSQGCLFFKNAELPDDLRKSIVNNNLQEYLYRSVTSTAIDDDGIAIEHSLRKMEVTVPCTLEGEILEVPDDFVDDLEKGLKFIKRLGQNRNRGLGRCKIEVI
jgi:CRISPR/Cas system CSM-associated protein Csm3 (group 7 of RAMP superfamily)